MLDDMHVWMAMLAGVPMVDGVLAGMPLYVDACCHVNA